jgi:hypothetical protein
VAAARLGAEVRDHPVALADLLIDELDTLGVGLARDLLRCVAISCANPLGIPRPSDQR